MTLPDRAFPLSWIPFKPCEASQFTYSVSLCSPALATAFKYPEEAKRKKEKREDKKKRNIYAGSAVLIGDLATTCAFSGTSLLRRRGAPPGCPGPSRGPVVTRATGGSVQPPAQIPSQPCTASGCTAPKLLKKARGGANWGW